MWRGLNVPNFGSFHQPRLDQLPLPRREAAPLASALSRPCRPDIVRTLDTPELLYFLAKWKSVRSFRLGLEAIVDRDPSSSSIKDLLENQIDTVDFGHSAGMSVTPDEACQAQTKVQPYW